MRQERIPEGALASIELVYGDRIGLLGAASVNSKDIEVATTVSALSPSGAAASMKMEPTGDATMAGRARAYGVGNWKHGVKQLTSTEFEATTQNNATPSRNPQPVGERRCLLFLPSKACWVLKVGPGRCTDAAAATRPPQDMPWTEHPAEVKAAGSRKDPSTG